MMDMRRGYDGMVYQSGHRLMDRGADTNKDLDEVLTSTRQAIRDVFSGTKKVVAKRKPNLPLPGAHSQS